ncbi:hypothetical protein TeGR_g12720 [Tetraparma gracilis]|uniref:PCFS4-like zinc finger domain-containing protein n=1 Tax=Tetraparma gracilis TaxID=2962635 RepID=A0ABQ6MFV0_9STRA|nr:hypothetical protein TeGR_g12720 [Tetraparma gracilis]
MRAFQLELASAAKEDPPENRVWFVDEKTWIAGLESLRIKEGGGEGGGEEAGPDPDVQPADEAFPSCGVCGKNFESAYSEDTGGFVYTNCRAVVVEEDNGMETDPVLVHGTCCEKLGIERGDVILRQQLI